MQRMIRTSAKAVIIKDTKLLVLELEDEDGIFYILPGGGQRADETLPEALVREVGEETGYLAKTKDPIAVIEGVKGEDFHRIDLVFEAELYGESTLALEPDRNQISVRWIPIDSLNTQPLYPSKLRRAIMNHAAGKQHIRYLGNEETGDPPVTE